MKNKQSIFAKVTIFLLVFSLLAPLVIRIIM